MAVDVDDLLVEEVAFEQEVGFIFRGCAGRGVDVQLHAVGSQLEIFDGDFVGFGVETRSVEFEDEPVDVGGVCRRGDGELAHAPEDASPGVEYRRTHEGGDTGPLIGVFRHGLLRSTRPYMLVLLPWVVQLCSRRRWRTGACW